MQNDKKKSFFRNFRDKGYYIVLGLCVAAVGVSGYLFSRSLKTPETVPSVSREVLAAPSVTVPAVTESKPKTDKRTQVLQEVIGTAAPQESEPVPGEQPKKPEASAPVDGEVVQTYSMEQLAYNPTTKDWRTHDGVDFLAPVGTEVKAAADGTVEAVYNDDFFGQTVTVRHSGGYVSHYANLAEEVLVSVGQTVKAGDLLGRTGQTALMEIGEEPHLHFAVYRNNVSVDPSDFLS